MPIDTRLDGRPEQVRATARWLSDQLAFEVGAGAAAMNTARTDAATGWQGAAGTAFGARMSRDAATAGELNTQLTATAHDLTVYADQLAKAQQHMANAREIAADGGLAIDGYVIRDPGTAPSTPDAAATPAMLTAHTDAVAAHQRQVDAYILADAEAAEGNAIWRFITDTWDNALDDVRQKWFFATGDLLNGVYGGFLKEHIDAVARHGDAALEEAKKLQGHYLKSQGGSAHSQSLITMVSDHIDEGRAAQERAASLTTKFAKKVPIIGYAITAAGVGYDIQHGKPAAKAILSGGASIGGSILGGMGTGALLGVTALGPVGVVIGVAAGGVVGGLLLSGAAEAGYDRLPDGVKDALNDGQAAVGRAVEEVGDDAEKLWNKIF